MILVKLLIIIFFAVSLYISYNVATWYLSIKLGDTSPQTDGTTTSTFYVFFGSLALCLLLNLSLSVAFIVNLTDQAFSTVMSKGFKVVDPRLLGLLGIFVLFTPLLLPMVNSSTDGAEVHTVVQAVNQNLKSVWALFSFKTNALPSEKATAESITTDVSTKLKMISCTLLLMVCLIMFI